MCKSGFTGVLVISPQPGAAHAARHTVRPPWMVETLKTQERFSVIVRRVPERDLRFTDSSVFTEIVCSFGGCPLFAHPIWRCQGLLRSKRLRFASLNAPLKAEQRGEKRTQGYDPKTLEAVARL